MEGLQRALYSIFLLSLLASIYRMLCRRNRSTQAPMLLVIVCVAGLVLPPLLQGTLDFEGLVPPPVEEQAPTDEWEKALCAQTERELAVALTQGLMSEFGLRQNTFSVQVEIARVGKQLSLRRVTVHLRAQDSYMKGDVAKYVREQTNTSVSVESNYGELEGGTI